MCMQSTSLEHGHALCYCKQTAMSIVQDGDYQVVLLFRSIMMSNDKRAKDCLLVVVLGTASYYQCSVILRDWSSSAKLTIQHV